MTTWCVARSVRAAGSASTRASTPRSPVPLPRLSRVWAALLYAGEGAAASHETAAELWGLLDVPERVVHVTVPVARRVAGLDDVRVHYAHRLAESRHPTRIPPVVRVEDTVLDLVDQATSAQAAMSWVTRACQRRRTTSERLGMALDARKKIRWRAATQRVLSEVTIGAESPLEIAYLRRVERPHGLPEGRRQARVRLMGRSQWTDVLYDAFHTIVELDGRVAHPDHERFRDHRRDNQSTVHGRSTLRYGWVDTTTDSCRVAQQVAAVLVANGWQGRPRRCGQWCTVDAVAA